MSKLTDPYTPCGSIPFTLCKLKLKEIFGSWGEVRVFNPPVVMPGCSLKSWRDLKSSCYLGPNPRNFDLIIQVERKILKTIVYFNSTVYLLSVLSLLSSCPSHKTCQRTNTNTLKQSMYREPTREPRGASAGQGALDLGSWRRWQSGPLREGTWDLQDQACSGHVSGQFLLDHFASDLILEHADLNKL